jgi:hypothetical protein
MLRLWKDVLAKVNNDHEAITSQLIDEIWDHLMTTEQVTGIPEPSEGGSDTLMDYTNTFLAIDDDGNEIKPDEPDNPEMGPKSPGLRSATCSISSNEEYVYERLEELGASKDILKALAPKATELSETQPGLRKKPAPLTISNPDFSRFGNNSMDSQHSSTHAAPYYSHVPPRSPNVPFAAGPSPSQERSHFLEPPQVPIAARPWGSSQYNKPDLSYLSQTLSGLPTQGYVLQPYSDARREWVQETFSYWRLAPVDSNRGPPIMLTNPTPPPYPMYSAVSLLCQVSS